MDSPPLAILRTEEFQLASNATIPRFLIYEGSVPWIGLKCISCFTESSRGFSRYSLLPSMTSASKHFLSGNASFLSLTTSSPSMTPSTTPTGALAGTIMSLPHVVKFAASIEEQEETFFVHDVPGKGKGVVAARDIKKGEFLFSERPLFMLNPSPTNSMLLGALSKCTRDEQRQYFTLANSYRKHLLPALAIWETNFLLLGNGTHPKAIPQPAGELAGIFLLASRLNSSCTPNVSKSWDEIRNVMVFRTLRDIQDGEELCFNYCDVLATHDDRKQILSKEFGFECICDACRLEGEEAVESDRRRTSILRLFDEVGRCAREPTLGIRKIKLALRMLKEESLIHYEASFCYDAFQFCVLVSDFSNAKMWIRRAWEVSCITSGPDSTAARVFKVYWANPRSHTLAATLPKATLSGPD